MNKLFLWAVALFNPIFERSGVDVFQLNEILKIKLLLDSRRPPAMFAGRKRVNTATTTKTPMGVIFVTLVFGIFYGLLLVFFDKPLVGQTVYFSVFMVLMSLTLITDFTSVLFDVRDQYIIGPRPVNDRTVAFARILHISIYVMKLALLQGLPGMIIVGFVDGPLATPLFFFQIIEATLLSILLVNVIYLILMRLVSPRRFKDIISYIQIGFSISIFVAYYLLPRLINMSRLGNFDLLKHQFAYFLPPVWIAAFNEVFLHHSRSNLVTSLMAFVGVTVPLVGIWFVARVLAPGFNRRLSVIAMSDGAGDQPKITKVQNTGLVDRLADFVARDPIENAGFRITWKLAARTREFKMRVYPQFAFVPVYFIYFSLNTKGDSLAERYYKLQQGKGYIFLIYLCIIVLSAILQQISQSEKYKASWVYYALPINKPGKVLAGMYKAIITLYFFPYCLVLSVASVVIWGPAIINDILLAFVICQIYGILMALFLVKGLPFSKPVLTKQSGGRIITSLLITMFAGVFGFVHYLLVRWEIVIWILIVPAMVIYWVMFNYYKKQTWDNIELTEID
jgi:ABC-2 type transport system permease protein